MERKFRIGQYSDAWNENPAFVKMPDGESLKKVQARAKKELELITRIYPPDTKILISSHNFVNLTIFNKDAVKEDNYE